MTLYRRDLDPDPFRQFANWYETAGRAGFIEPTAVVLATADVGGRPSARVVLLKSWDVRGFVFFSNATSRKGRDLEENRRGALLFWWDRLGRQVRIEGSVDPIDAAESDAYFATRPRESQLGAHASPQSQAIASRSELEGRVEAAARLYGDGSVPRPQVWGGYRVRPARFEFWSQGSHRLHDRFAYALDPPGAWRIERLAP